MKSFHERVASRFRVRGPLPPRSWVGGDGVTYGALTYNAEELEFRIFKSILYY